MVGFTGADISRNHNRPSLTHMAIAKLMEENHIKTILTENTDNLHRLSGMPVGNEIVNRLFELHGNSYLEIC